MTIFPAKLLVALDTLPIAPVTGVDVDLAFDELSAFSLKLHALTLADELAIRYAWRATITLNGKPLLVGTVDGVGLSEEKEGGELELSGRERAAAAADCSCIDTADYNGLTLAAVAPKILAPFKLTAKLGPTAAKKKVKAKPLGERPLDYLRNVAGEAGLIVWTDPLTGVINIDEPAAVLAIARAKPPIRIARLPEFTGNNVESFRLRDDKARKMNSVMGTGKMRIEPIARTAAATQQVPAFAQGLPLPSARPPADPQLAEYRPLALDVRADSLADLAKRITRELNRRVAEAFTLSYVLAGWTDRTGAPYGHLRMAEVADAKHGIYGTFFVKACRFQSHRAVKGDAKACTTLDLIDPGVLAA